MRVHMALVLAAGLLVAADKPSEEAKKELKKFQGEWVAVSREENGKKASGDALGGFTLTIKDDTATVIGAGRTSKGTFTLDPTKKPKQFDYTGKYGDKEIKVTCIYEFAGDRLKVCSTEGGEERPKEFSTKDGTAKNPIVLTVYKRAKKAK